MSRSKIIQISGTDKEKEEILSIYLQEKIDNPSISKSEFLRSKTLSSSLSVDKKLNDLIRGLSNE